MVTAGDAENLRGVKEVDIKGPVDGSKRIPAPDCRRQRITAQCMVEIVDGPFKSKVGTVVHVSKPYLWVQCTGVAKVWLVQFACMLPFARSPFKCLLLYTRQEI